MTESENSSNEITSKFVDLENVLQNCKDFKSKIEFLDNLSTFTKKSVLYLTDNSLIGFELKKKTSSNNIDYCVNNLKNVLNVDNGVIKSPVSPVKGNQSKIKRPNNLLKIGRPKKAINFTVAAYEDSSDRNFALPRKSKRIASRISTQNNSRTLENGLNSNEEIEVYKKRTKDVFEHVDEYICVLCENNFESIESLLQHIDENHYTVKEKIDKFFIKSKRDALQCNECDEHIFKVKQVGKTLLELIKHRKEIHDHLPPKYVRIFLCSVCNEEFLTKDDFTYHNKNSHMFNLRKISIKKRDGNVIYCFSLNLITSDTPFSKTPKKRSKYLKMEMYKDEGPFTCFICNYQLNKNDDNSITFSNLVDMFAHIKDVHLITDEKNLRRSLKCPLCENGQFHFHKGNALKRGVEMAYQQVIHHMIKIHRLSLPSYCFRLKCKNCSYETVSHKYLQQHERVQHDDELTSLCDLCGQKVKKAGMKSHLISCSKKNNALDLYETLTNHAFKCDICGLLAHRKSIIKRHIMRMHKMLPNYKCDHCTFTFYNKQEKDMHTFKAHAIASKDVIKCQHCNYQTITKWLMKKHILKHDTGRFICPTCQTESSTKRGLLEHIRRAHKNKPKKINCTICSFSTYLQTQLQKHFEKIHKEYLKYCNICQYSAISDDILEKHCLRVHRMTKNGNAINEKFNMDENISVINSENMSKKNNKACIVESQLESNDGFVLHNINDKIQQAAIEAGLVTTSTSKYLSNSSQEEMFVNVPMEYNEEIVTGHEVILMPDGNYTLKTNVNSNV